MEAQYVSTPLELPSSVVEASCGFALDIGFSTIKVAYRSKDDYCNGKPLKDELKSGKGRIYLVSNIPTTRTDDLITLLGAQCDLQQSSTGGIEVICSGLGADNHREQLETELNVRLKTVLKSSSCARGFRELSKVLTLADLVTPVSEKAVAEGEVETEMILKFVTHESFKEWGFGSSELNLSAPGKDEQDGNSSPVFPCMLVVCGSAVTIVKIHEDGRHQLLSESPFGGQLFLGLSHALTGKTDFAEMYRSVEVGSSRSIDEYASDLVSSGGEEDDSDHYSIMKDFEKPTMPFGKAVTGNKEDIKEDDMIHSLYRVACLSVLEIARSTAMAAGVQDVYVCGSFVDTDMGRDWMYVEDVVMNAINPDKNNQTKLRFIKLGRNLGSIGAFILGTEQ